MEKLGGEHDEYAEDVPELFNSLEDDPQMGSLKSFKAMLKLYTHQCVFGPIAKEMSRKNFRAL